MTPITPTAPNAIPNIVDVDSRVPPDEDDAPAVLDGPAAVLVALLAPDDADAVGDADTVAGPLV